MSFEPLRDDETAANTHVFLWFISGDERLPKAMYESVRDLDKVYLSVVSLWEAIVKYELCKLPLPHSPRGYLPLQREKHQISSLPLDEASVSHLSDLPRIHRDPFDRMLICQALEHGLIIVTVDDLVCAYPIPTLTQV